MKDRNAALGSAYEISAELAVQLATELVI